jgi:hypothetical protein
VYNFVEERKEEEEKRWENITGCGYSRGCTLQLKKG